MTDIKNLTADELIEALRNSEFCPKYKITEHSLVGRDYKRHGEDASIYIYSVKWEDVDDYTDLLLSCDTLYITEFDGILYADI